MTRVTCLLNGLLDVPLNDLDGLSPLQKAHTPVLDQLAAASDIIRLTPPEGIAWESAFLSLFGVTEGLDCVASGPVEALALGRKLEEDQIAYSLRFVASAEGVIVDASDELLNDSECKLICSELSQATSLEFWPLQGPRALVIAPKRPLVCSPNDPSAVDPIGRHWKDWIPDPALVPILETASSVLIQHSINELRFDLEQDPVCGFLLYGAGNHQHWETPWEVIQPLLFTPNPLFQGVARVLGADLWQLPVEHRRFSHITPLLKRLEEMCFQREELILDLPYLWASTYRGDLLEKIKTLEWLDRHWLDPLWQFCKAKGHDLVVLALRPCDIRAGAAREGDSLALSWPGSSPLSQALSEQSLEELEAVPLHMLLARTPSLQTDS